MTRLLNVKETAKLLNLAEITVYKMVSQGRIPFTKIGTRTLFRLEEIEAWVQENSIKQRCGNE